MQIKRRPHASEYGVGLKVFAADELEYIHLATLEILERTGIWVEDDEALNIFADGGCRVDRETHIVKIPAQVVEDAILAAPARVTVAARDPQRDLVLEADRVHVETGQFATQVRDLATGERRIATRADAAEAARICDALGNIDLFMPPVMPSDCEEVPGLYLYRDALANTTMALHVGPYGPTETDALIEMAQVVFGKDVDLRDRSPFVAAYCFTSPLSLTADMTVIGLPAARAGLPVQLNTMPVIGSSGPATVAGTLALTNAEALALNTLTQLAERGTPVIYSCLSQSFDMKAGMVTSGSPETALLQCGAAQLSQHYRIPCYVMSIWSDSKVSDGQAGHENTLGAMSAMLSGANIVSGAGMLEAGLTYSHAQLLMSDEVVGMVRKFAEGVAVSDETLLVDAVDEVGIGKAYLRHESTRKYARSGSQPALIDRRPFDDWQNDGAADLAARTAAEATRILAEHEVEPLPGDVLAELDAVITRAAEKARAAV